MFGARFYCALTLHVSAPIGGNLQVHNKYEHHTLLRPVVY
jgi:hypothetical protein